MIGDIPVCTPKAHWCTRLLKFGRLDSLSEKYLINLLKATTVLGLIATHCFRCCVQIDGHRGVWSIRQNRHISAIGLDRRRCLHGQIITYEIAKREQENENETDADSDITQWIRSVHSENKCRSLRCV